MSAAALITRRFNTDEVTIHRLSNQSPAFRSLCDDYVTACSAFERWQEDHAKAQDYREIIAELEREISSIL